MTLPDPNGCALCGLPERGHGIWYNAQHLGGGGYVAPTDAVRLERMKARRAASQNQETPR